MRQALRRRRGPARSRPRGPGGRDHGPARTLGRGQDGDRQPRRRAHQPRPRRSSGSRARTSPGSRTTRLNELRQRMAVVLQGTLPFTCGLFFSLNVYENVAFALRQRNRWSEARVNETTMTHLEMVGLRDRAESMPDELSAGMCKRVAIARALALEAADRDRRRLRLRDRRRPPRRCSARCSPTSSAETGATFLVTTHSMSAARRLADHVAVISDGRHRPERARPPRCSTPTSRWCASWSPGRPAARSRSPTSSA